MRRVLLILAVFCASTLPTSARAAGTTDCGNDCPVGDENPVPDGGDRSVPMPEHGADYCDHPSYPDFYSYGLDQFLTANDEIIQTGTPDNPAPPSGPVVIPDIAIAQKFVFWCNGPVHPFEIRADTFWVPIASADSVVYSKRLLARVQGLLTTPTVTWRDANPENGWLFVNLEHHAGIIAPGPVYETDSDGNEFTGYARAWVRATPVSLTLELPSSSGVTREALGTCDLTEATSAKGCAMKFTHSSSISDDGWFHGTAKITWEITSNSGKYNGVGPFTTTGKFQIQVAEVMAVGGG